MSEIKDGVMRMMVDKWCKVEEKMIKTEARPLYPRQHQQQRRSVRTSLATLDSLSTNRSHAHDTSLLQQSFAVETRTMDL